MPDDTSNDGTNDPIRTFFANIAKRGFDARLHGATGVCRVDVEGEGSWRVTNRDGHLTVEEGPGPADCYIVMARDDMIALIRGERNPITTAMQGRIQTGGDYALAQVAQRIFPDPSVLQPEFAAAISDEFFGMGGPSYAGQNSQHP